MTLQDLAIGQTLKVSPTPLLSDPYMQHLGEDFRLTDLEVGEEVSYKPRFKPMKKLRGKELVDFRRNYRKERVQRLREQKLWRRKNKQNLKRRAKMRHYRKRT